MARHARRRRRLRQDIAPGGLTTTIFGIESASVGLVSDCAKTDAPLPIGESPIFTLMGKLVSEFSEALPANARGAFCFALAMRTKALPSGHYRDPMEVAIANQEREAREKRRAEAQPRRPILTLKESDADKAKRSRAAREALEALFDIPAAASR